MVKSCLYVHSVDWAHEQIERGLQIDLWYTQFKTKMDGSLVEVVVLLVEAELVFLMLLGCRPWHFCLGGFFLLFLCFHCLCIILLDCMLCI